MGVQFEDNSIPRAVNSEPTPKIAGWLIKKGLARTVEGANKMQVVAAIIFFALAIYFII
jgi:hypothetical protein